MTEVLRAAANRNGALAPGNETRALRLPDGAGAGIAGLASGSGARLVARTMISAAAVLPTQIRIIDPRIFQSDGGIIHPASSR